MPECDIFWATLLIGCYYFIEHTHLQSAHLATDAQNVPDTIHVDADGQLQFLVKAHRGCTMEDDVHVADQRLSVGECEAQSRQRTVSGHGHDLVAEFGYLSA